MVAYAASLGSIDNAINYYDSWVVAAGLSAMKAPNVFLRRNFRKFLQTGSIQDLPRSGRPPRLPDHIALRASYLVKLGYEVKVYFGDTTKEPLVVRKYFNSIRQACDTVPELAAILTEYNITPSKLLARMHQVDKHLTYMKLHYKLELTQPQKDARLEFSGAQLQLIAHNKEHLLRVFYMDEASILIVPGGDPNIKIWADSRNHDVQQVLHIPNLPKGKFIKVHFVVVVNPLLGPVFMEMTSGTTDIVREHNTKGPYLVSSGLCSWEGSWGQPDPQTASLPCPAAIAQLLLLPCEPSCPLQQLIQEPQPGSPLPPPSSSKGTRQHDEAGVLAVNGLMDYEA